MQANEDIKERKKMKLNFPDIDYEISFCLAYKRSNINTNT